VDSRQWDRHGRGDRVPTSRTLADLVRLGDVGVGHCLHLLPAERAVNRGTRGGSRPGAWRGEGVRSFEPVSVERENCRDPCLYRRTPSVDCGIQDALSQ